MLSSNLTGVGFSAGSSTGAEMRPGNNIEAGETEWVAFTPPQPLKAKATDRPAVQRRIDFHFKVISLI